MNDKIIAQLRSSTHGISSRDIARQFLKFNDPEPTLADTAVSAILADDARCYKDERNVWHIVAFNEGQEQQTLQESPLCAVSIRPVVRHGTRVAFELVLTALQEQNEPLVNATFRDRCVDPNLSPGTQGNDEIPSPARQHSLLQQAATILTQYKGVYLSYYHYLFLQRQLRLRAIPAVYDALFMDEMLPAAGETISRFPLTLSQCCEMYCNAPADSSHQAARHGTIFSFCIRECLRGMAHRNIETEQQLDKYRIQRARQQYPTLSLPRTESLDTITTGAGVCAIKDVRGSYLYIAASGNCRTSLLGLLNHCSRKDETYVLDLVQSNAHEILVTPCGSLPEALVYEHNAVHTYQPLHSALPDSAVPDAFVQRLESDAVIILPHAQQSKCVAVGLKTTVELTMVTCERSDAPTGADRLHAFFSAAPESRHGDPRLWHMLVWWLQHNLDTAAVVDISPETGRDELQRQLQGYFNAV